MIGDILDLLYGLALLVFVFVAPIILGAAIKRW